LVFVTKILPKITACRYALCTDCDVGPPANRVDCGFPGIQPQVCYDRGCCWDSTISGVKWCFHGKNITVSQSIERLRGVITTRRYTNPRLPLPLLLILV